MTEKRKPEDVLLVIKRKIDDCSSEQLHEKCVQWSSQLVDIIARARGIESIRMAALCMSRILEAPLQDASVSNDFIRMIVPRLIKSIVKHQTNHSYLPHLLPLFIRTCHKYPKAVKNDKMLYFLRDIMDAQPENMDELSGHLSALIAVSPLLQDSQKGMPDFTSLRDTLDHFIVVLLSYLDLRVPSAIRGGGWELFSSPPNFQLSDTESFLKVLTIFEILANAISEWKYLNVPLSLSCEWLPQFSSLLELLSDESTLKKIMVRPECHLIEVWSSLCWDAMSDLVPFFRLSPNISFRYGHGLWRSALAMLTQPHLKNTRLRVSVYSFVIAFIRNSWHFHLSDTSLLIRLVDVCDQDLQGVYQTATLKEGSQMRICKSTEAMQVQEKREIVKMALTVIHELMDNNICALSAVEQDRSKTNRSNTSSTARRCLEVMSDLVLSRCSQPSPALDKADVLWKLCEAICSVCCGAISVAQEIMLPSFFLTFLKSCRSCIDAEHRVRLEILIRRLTLYSYLGQMEAIPNITFVLPSSSQPAGLVSSAESEAMDEDEASSVEEDGTMAEEGQDSPASEVEIECPFTSRKRRTASPVETTSGPPQKLRSVAEEARSDGREERSVARESRSDGREERSVSGQLRSDDREERSVSGQSRSVGSEVSSAAEEPRSVPSAPVIDEMPDDIGEGPSLSEMLAAFEPDSESD